MAGMNTDNMVFVFGSNLAGIHGAGAALYAASYKGARYGVGVGRTGQSYAIPTKDSRIETLPLDKIQKFVDEFIAYAKERPTLMFQVTCIGCGLAGHKHEDIAPMFLKCNKADYPNIWFDNIWMHYFCATGNMSPAGYNIWGTF